LVNATKHRGQTALPLGSANDRYRLRADFYDSIKLADETASNKFQIQLNAKGQKSRSLYDWANKRGGAHAVLGSLFVKKSGTKQNVVSTYADFHGAFQAE
jgi:hypothetical protein